MQYFKIKVTGDFQSLIQNAINDLENKQCFFRSNSKILPILARMMKCPKIIITKICKDRIKVYPGSIDQLSSD